LEILSAQPAIDGVIGISDPIEITINRSLPRVVKTALIPFKDKII